VAFDQRLDVAKDLQRDLSVLLDRSQDLHVLHVGLVRFGGRMLERQAVFLRLAVARQQQDRSCVRGLNAEG
jgi:hypothetical protein